MSTALVRIAIPVVALLAIVSFCEMLAQPASGRVRFEAADVHRSSSLANVQSYRSGGFLRGDRYSLRKVTMMDLLRLAYGFDTDFVVGGPEWLELVRFDISAKAPPATSTQDLRLMLQSLLSDRFKLVLREDTRPMPAFGLKLGRDKTKLRAADGIGAAECKYQPQPSSSPFTVYSCRNMTMSGFVQQLPAMAGDYLADPVVDETGLNGIWDFDLKWNSRSRVLPEGVDRTSIFTTIDQQLGLRLMAEKAPAKVVVIDSVSETPTKNVPNIAELLPPQELQFEVASVRQSRPDVHDGFSGPAPGGAFEVRAETMRNLFATAWDVHWDHVDELIAGMPKWMDSARYDILAKPASAANGPPPPRSSFVDDDLRTMLRTLLIDRFKIKTHYEDRAVNAYTLVAHKPRLKKADPANRPNCKEAHTVANDPRDQNPLRSRLLACQNVTLAEFAAQLLPLSPNDFTYAVEDASAIRGRWDFMLNYTPTGDPRNPSGGWVLDPAEPDGKLSIFQAVTKLGLKLELRKRKVPVLVIDSMQQEPIEN